MMRRQSMPRPVKAGVRPDGGETAFLTPGFTGFSRGPTLPLGVPPDPFLKTRKRTLLLPRAATFEPCGN